MRVSFVIPCYKSAKTIGNVIAEIEETMQQLRTSWEIILIDDASPDEETWPFLKNLNAKNDNITCIRLARNFGQHAAIMAGLHNINGDVVVCMDDDGQTPANEVGNLLAKLGDDCDVVYARYQNKKHNMFRNMGSAVNEKMAELLLGKPHDLYVSSYFAAKRFIIDEMLKYRNPYPYVIGLVLRSTNKIKNVDVNHRSRTIGESGYSIKKLIGLWMNGFTSFSVKPLRIATLTGVVTAMTGLIYAIIVIVNKIINSTAPVGWSSVVCIMLTLGGIIMIMLGLIGEYIGRIYISINSSPQYVVREFLLPKCLIKDPGKVTNMNDRMVLN